MFKIKKMLHIILFNFFFGGGGGEGWRCCEIMFTLVIEKDGSEIFLKISYKLLLVVFLVRSFVLFCLFVVCLLTAYHWPWHWPSVWAWCSWPLSGGSAVWSRSWRRSCTPGSHWLSAEGPSTGVFYKTNKIQLTDSWVDE